MAGRDIDPTVLGDRGAAAASQDRSADNPRLSANQRRKGDAERRASALADLIEREGVEIGRRAFAEFKRRHPRSPRPKPPTYKRVEWFLTQLDAIGDEMETEDPDDTMPVLRLIVHSVDHTTARVVKGLRRNHTDAQIGASLGITKQAVRKRWPRAGGR